MENKTLTNTTASQAKDNVKDIVFWGNGDTFKLISKASSIKEGWMKSTKAMEIEGVGCVVQVTTQQLNNTNSYKLWSKAEVDEAIEKNIEIDYTTTLKNSVIAEALTFVPGVRIEETIDQETGIVTERKLVKI